MGGVEAQWLVLARATVAALQNQKLYAVQLERYEEAALLKREIQAKQAAIVAKEEEISSDSAAIETAKAEATAAEEEAERLGVEYQNMCAGISSGEGDEGMTLPDQISKAHSDANNAESRSKQAKMKITHLTKTMKVRL